MKKFCMKLAIIIFILLATYGSFVCFCFVKVLPQYTQNFDASLIDKMNRLKSIDETKIVLIGNSNLAFGIDSGLLEKEIGMPVVNMGLYGGLGNAFHEEMARVNVHEGDIMVVCHTTYEDDDTISSPEAWITVENHIGLWQLIRAKDIDGMLKALPDYLFRAIKLWRGDIGNTSEGGYYCREAFNVYGDIELERNQTEYEFTSGSVQVPKINDICTNRLNRLNNYLSKRGAHMVIAAYPIGSGDYTPPKEQYTEFQVQLQKKVDCQIISDYTDYFFDYQYFFDTNYHLTSEGACKRTLLLAEDIKRYMKNIEKY